MALKFSLLFVALLCALELAGIENGGVKWLTRGDLLLPLPPARCSLEAAVSERESRLSP